MGGSRANRISASRKGKVPALIMPRGVGDRYYCTFNTCKAFSYSGVELYLPDILWDSDLHYCLWAYLNSSLAWLFREITGRRNLGGGLLKAEVTDLKMLPVDFDFDFAKEAKAIFNALKDRAPLPLAQEIRTLNIWLLTGWYSITLVSPISKTTPAGDWWSKCHSA